MRSCSSRDGLGYGCSTRVLDPAPLLRVLDVHVLDADGAAVRVAQHAEEVPQLHHRLAAEAAGGELAVEVPQGQPVGGDVEVGVAALLVLQRVGVGHQVAAHPVGVDELLHPRGLVDLVVVRDRDVLDPADRLVRDPQRVEDPIVEAVLAEQLGVHDPQEVAGLGALDDPVVVGRGQRERCLLTASRFRVSSEAPWYSAGYSIAPTPMMQPWPFISRGTECYGADRAGVGQRQASCRRSRRR